MGYTPNNPDGAATAANSAPVTLATDSNGPVKVSNGTNVADVLAADSGFNPQVAAGAVKTLTFSTSATGAQTLLANTDVRGYAWIDVVLTQTGAGLAFTGGQFSNVSGGTYYTPANSAWKTAGSGAAGLSTAVGVVSGIPVKGNFFQLAISAMTSGTTAGYVILHAFPPPADGAYVQPTSGATFPVTQSGSWSGVGVTGTVAATQSGSWFTDPIHTAFGANQAITGTGTITSSFGSNWGGTTYGWVAISGTYAGVSFTINVNSTGSSPHWLPPVYDVGAQCWLAPGTTISPGTNANKLYMFPMAFSGSNGNNLVNVVVSAYTSGTASLEICVPLTTSASPGSTMAQIMDAAGNSRGVNVTAENSLQTAEFASASGGYSYSNLSANGTTTVKSGAGFLHTVSINNVGSADTVTLYDNTTGSGTKIATIGSSSEQTFLYDLEFTTGLTVVVAGTTAPDVTVTYK